MLETKVYFFEDWNVKMYLWIIYAFYCFNVEDDYYDYHSLFNYTTLYMCGRKVLSLFLLHFIYLVVMTIINIEIIIVRRLTSRSGRSIHRWLYLECTVNCIILDSNSLKHKTIKVIKSLLGPDFFFRRSRRILTELKSNAIPIY